jgi:hypothetical protein
MNSPTHNASVFAATCRAPTPVPDITLSLHSDLASTFQAHTELHRLLREAPPQRRIIAGLLVNTLLDSHIAATGRGHDPLRLGLWRLPRRLHIELLTPATLRLGEQSRLMLDRLAEHWEHDIAAGAVRVDVRTTLVEPSRDRLANT